MNVLVVEVGGTHVKVLVSGEREPRKFASGSTLTAKQMVAGVKKVTGDWNYDAVSIGLPGPVLRNRRVADHAIWEAVGLALTSGRHSAVK